MARSLFIIVTEEYDLIQKARTWGVDNNVTVQAFSSQQWSEGLQNPSFRAQVQTETVLSTGAGGKETTAKIYPFPVQSRDNGGNKGQGVMTMNELESVAITNAIIQHKGNLTEAAKALGIGRATIYRKIKQYNIDPQVARTKGNEAA
ncbi:MAG TPA: helix-turn-helix domain-containing protein [Bdellovibrionales bacterium]|nr:helix-turn-helix domain-containing protein [Bdellovibrionales bacterium]